MGYTKELKPNSIVKFVFTEPFTKDNMKEVLGLLTRMLDLKKPFAFFVDARTANKVPMNAASVLLSWMRANKSRFKEYLICSAVVMSNSTTNNVVSALLKGVFAIQPTVSPNYLTMNYEKGELWVNDQVKKFNENKNKSNN